MEDDPLPAVRAQLDADLGGAYHVIRMLGRGAFGAVYLARDRVLHRHVAIKVLRLERAASESERARFRGEARTAALLDHPNIAPILSFVETPSTLYMVMPYIGGESLAQRLEKLGRLPPALVRHVLREIAVALAHAHRIGVVHRDLKPENVLLTAGDDMHAHIPPPEGPAPGVLPRVRLVDFGIAAFPYRDRGAGTARDHGGTPNFMSPEQALGDADTGPRSDVYALGVLGYLLLTGRLPFTGASLSARVTQQRHGPPLRLARAAPRAPSDLAVAIERCLSFDPSKRWRNVRELHAALAPGLTWQRWSPRALLARLGVRIRSRRMRGEEWVSPARTEAGEPGSSPTPDAGGASQAGFDPGASQAGIRDASSSQGGGISQASGDVLQGPKNRLPWSG